MGAKFVPKRPTFCIVILSTPGRKAIRTRLVALVPMIDTMFERPVRFVPSNRFVLRIGDHGELLLPAALGKTVGNNVSNAMLLVLSKYLSPPTSSRVSP